MLRRTLLTVILPITTLTGLLYAIDWNEFEWSSYNLKFNVPAQFKVTANTKKSFIAKAGNSLRFQIVTVTANNDEELVATSNPPRKKSMAKRSSPQNDVSDDADITDDTTAKSTTNSTEKNDVIKPRQFTLAKGLSASMTAKRQRKQNEKFIVVTLEIYAAKSQANFIATWSWPDDEKTNGDNLEISYDMAKSFQLIE